ncbi:hypothetical protein PRZ48_007325 [Zasmidium cellare]|uniref:Uncharacterized protein n=1 Tax=Zasmidium cellare TaxID=395010 RepID=A0ABR0EK36_ZASCE|nr:hypothetical protein PRZ48_007325 [Zasmidium cellare]
MTTPRKICQIFTPIGMIGYGFNVDEMHETLAGLTSNNDVPTAIICDSGSTDSGPRKLATGDMTCPRAAYKRDLGRLLEGVKKYKTPLLIGSAGGAGVDAHVEELTGILGELGRENAYDLKVIQIFASIDKAMISKRLAAGTISPCGSGVPQLEQQDVDDCPTLVAQMGHEPYLAAIDQYPDYDVILAGRAYDPSPYMAFAIKSIRKLQPDYTSLGKEHVSRIHGAMMHAGKILECGGLCAVPKSVGAVATIFEDGSFDVRPTSPVARCTALSVAAHSLYEKSRPDLLFGPGGYLDVTQTKFVENSDGVSVHVSGSIFRTSIGDGNPYQVKLEGARNKGYRAIYTGFIRDHLVRSQMKASLADGTWDLDWHIYGRDSAGNASGDVYLVGESRAPTQELARGIVAVARTWTIHASYPGQKATSGSFGFGVGGVNEIDTGPCSEFCVYHLMDLQPGEEVSLFPFKLVEMKYGDHIPAWKGYSEKTPTTNGTNGHKKDKPLQIPFPESRPSEARTLGDAAKVLRSKNAGPYEITFDVMFDRRDVYDAVKSSGVLSPSVIASLYGMEVDEIIWSGFFDPALAFKATVPRRRRGIAAASGGYFEDDVHGSQMYLPLMLMELPQDLRATLAKL